MVNALISLGSNLGDRAATLTAAINSLRGESGVEVVAVSDWRETQPIGGPAGQPPFLNGAARLRTSLAPRELLTRLQAIESQQGRTRLVHWSARTLDLDLLLYGNAVIDEPRLIVPHPRMAYRKFVLAPVAEIAGDMVHPTTGWTVRQLWEHAQSALNYYAVTGPDRELVKNFAFDLADHIGAVLIVSGDDESPGQGQGVGIECEQFRIAAIAQLQDASSGKLFVSDFWLGEGNSAQDAAGSAQRSRSEFIVSPKLIICLAQYRNNRNGFSDRRRRLSSVPLPWRRLAEPGLGPVLFVSPGLWEESMNEAIAAIDAMS